MSDQPIRIFVSYSHADAEYLAESSLLGFLRGLEREGAELWTDERIAAGGQWDDEIRGKLSQADIALVLVSQSFLDSAYCTSVEIAGLLDRSRGLGMVIFPVILSPCEWERHSWLQSTQHLPGGGETLEEDFRVPGARKRLFLDIRTHLREQIERIRQARAKSPQEVVSAEPPITAQRPIAGERRQITALECDLTALGSPGSVDLEKVLEILPKFQSQAAEIVHRLDGHIAQRLGRRLLAYFGCPRLHEDDARRAVIAAREMLRLVKDLERSAGGAERGVLALKLAIHTGPMVVSVSPGTAEPLLVGDTPDEVAAIMSLAEPNRIHLSSATHALIERELACAEAGTAEIKGGRSLPFYVLEDQDTSPGKSAGPRVFVAREQELEHLRQRWELARESTGQVVLIRGEPGLGKTTLLRAFRAEVTNKDMIWLECRCSPYHQNTELYPLIDLLQRMLALAMPERPIGDRERLKVIVRRMGLPVETAVPLLCILLSIPLAADDKPPNLSPEGRKKETLAVVLDLVLRLAERQPVLLTVEDLHWIDASTRGFLDLLLETQATAPVLSLLTYRPEFEPTWKHLSYLSEISLRRLGSQETGTLVSLLAGDKLLPPELAEEIVQNADGIPLFAEELTKMVMEAELVKTAKGRYQLAAGGEKLAVPATLEGSLIARLDRLGTAKEIAQVASVIGREFSCDLLSRIVAVDEATLHGGLERLLESEIILRRGLLSDASYLFKHALIQQAAYESVLKRDARQLHRKIAQALEDKFPDFADRQPEVVAFHFTRAGMTEKAIDHWQRAGERSIKNSANPEAVAHLTKCLELLAKLPEIEERDRREMRLRIALTLPLIATKGYAAVEVDEMLARARNLCTEVGEETELFRVLRLFWPYQNLRGELGKGHEAAQQMLSIAERLGSAHLRLEANRALGSSLFYLGRMEEARQHFASAMTFYDRERDHAHVLIYGQDPGVSCLANEALTLWFMGYPERALASGAEAVTLARELAHPYSLCFTLFFRGWQYLFLRDLEKLHECAEEMILVSRQQSFALWETMGLILRGWVRTQRRESAGLATMEEGIARWRKLGARLYVPSFLSLVADAHAEGGSVAAGLAAVEEGLAILREGGEAFCEPELYRLKGELLWLQAGRSAAGCGEAEACLVHAREAAARQASKSLELRAAISLSRLWLAAGKREAAQRVLDETRRWFSEGGETYDLKRADALRAELAG